MNATPMARRPLGCLKASLRQARQQRVFCRQLATATIASQASMGALPDHNFYRINDPKTKALRTAFAVYMATPPSPSALAARLPPAVPAKKPKAKIAILRNTTMPPVLTAPPSNPMPLLHQTQIKQMDPTGARTALFAKNRHGVRPGDVLQVTHRRGGEPFAGVCLQIRRAGIDSSILLRTHLGKVGVEMWYKIYNKNVAGIDLVKRRAKRARRARLMYMRQPQHDMGSVSELVFAWKKTRKVMTSAPAKGSGGDKAKDQAAAKKKK
ncbi:translation protein SH3-like domain-containing protein [Podospora didyma]|uniref:Translation protein SH3-like domain-containing protein n=1 Tax=Podospora didyma TaxID=330526 RepID=A0AAE0KFD9_9PEZI|nr:translation protein SH3-like domain-containing protein [Podospora didyma]